MIYNVPVDFTEAIEWARKRGVQLPEEYYSQNGLARARGFTVSSLESLSEIEDVLESLNKALETGITFKQWQETVDLDSFTRLSQNRKETVFRTFLQSAYNAGRWDQQTRNPDRRYLMYDAVNDGRTRPSHKAMDGIIRPIDDPFWKTHYCPNGFNCRCVCIALTEQQALARSRGMNGLRKPVTEEMVPDKGWDYNVGESFDDMLAAQLKKRRDGIRNAALLVAWILIMKKLKELYGTEVS